MPELGRAALIICLGLAAYALVAGAYAAVTRRRRLSDSAQNALLAAFAAAGIASAVLFAALLRNDFSFTYVADHTSRELPTRKPSASPTTTPIAKPAAVVQKVFHA